jgi:hypothetical protein
MSISVKNYVSKYPLYNTYEEMCLKLPIQFECEYSKYNHSVCKIIYNLALKEKRGVKLSREDKELVYDSGLQILSMGGIQSLIQCMLLLQTYTPLGHDRTAFVVAWLSWNRMLKKSL